MQLAVEPQATLCVERVCTPRNVADRSIETSELPRPFVWIAPDRTRVIAGTLAVGAAILPLDEPGMSHRFAIRFSDAPVPATFTLTGGDTRWSWTMTAPATAVTLLHSNASTLVISAVEHRIAERALTPSARDLGPIDLKRFPVLTGTVVDAATFGPVARAEVSLSSGKRAAITDDVGRFRIAIEDVWPSSLSIVSPGHAPKVVPVPQTVADTELPRIALAVGGALRLTVDGVPSEAMSWQLRAILTENKDELRREGAFAAGQSATRIEGIDAGRYRLVLKGDQPLEQFSTPVEIRDGQQSDAALTIHPLAVRIETRLGEQALGDATVLVTHASAQWTERLTTDADGVLKTNLWQPGQLNAVMSRHPNVHAWVDEQTIEGDTAWTIRAIDRKIRGRVLDAETGQPLGGTAVMLEMHSGLLLRSVAAADGTYEIGGVVPGSHLLFAFRNGYQNDKKDTVVVRDADAVIEKTVMLEPFAEQVPLLAENARAMPVAGAAVFFASRAGVREVAVTDANGRASVPLSVEGETGVVFVVPRSGSLGFARIPRPEERAGNEVVLRVPDGSARVEVRAESGDGRPVSSVGLMIRWNGMFLPMEVLARIHEIQGSRLLTDASGRIVFPHLPPGQYELWPFASREEFRRVYYGTPPAPAATVQIAPGPQTIVLKFDGA